MKVIVAGSRTFNSYELLEKILDKYDNITEIVCGGAKGADMLGYKYAALHQIPTKVFRPNWEELGKCAGMIRNHKMGDYADFLIAFWDGKSHGTKDMIDYMKKLNKHGEVILF